MADTTVATDPSSFLDANSGLWGPYWSDPDTAVIIYFDGSDDLRVSRTTDAGVGWTESTLITGTIKYINCWFDKETPGDTGDTLHIVVANAASDDIEYLSYDVAAGSAGTLRVVAASQTVTTTNGSNPLAVTKTVGGNLLA